MPSHRTQAPRQFVRNCIVCGSMFFIGNRQGSRRYCYNPCQNPRTNRGLSKRHEGDPVQRAVYQDAKDALKELRDWMAEARKGL